MRIKSAIMVKKSKKVAKKSKKAKMPMSKKDMEGMMSKSTKKHMVL